MPGPPAEKRPNFPNTFRLGGSGDTSLFHATSGVRVCADEGQGAFECLIHAFTLPLCDARGC